MVPPRGLLAAPAGLPLQAQSCGAQPLSGGDHRYQEAHFAYVIKLIRIGIGASVYCGFCHCLRILGFMDVMAEMVKL